MKALTLVYMFGHVNCVAVLILLKMYSGVKTGKIPVCLCISAYIGMLMYAHVEDMTL